MATIVTNTTFGTTYKDDFVDSDNYHRILFNSGKALQAREVTQLQTIIQEEISRFGSNIFIEGGMVQGSGYTVNNSLEFIKLASNQLPSDVTTLIGQEFTEDSTGLSFKISEVVLAATTGDADTLYGKYVKNTTQVAGGATPVRIGNSATLRKSGLDNLITASSSATGVGTKVSVTGGSFFVQGHFVFAKEQSLIVSYYSGTPNLTIGFKVNEEVVTITDDDALYDNQGSVPNIAAPGADRYRIRLSLIDKANITTGENFVYLFRLKDGAISDEARVDNSYNRINDVLALRTREESGNYITNDFIANFDIDSDNSGPNIILKVSDGVAYVDGFRLATGAKDITVQRPRTTTTINNETIRASYGNFVDVRADGTNNKGLPEINTFQKLKLTADSDLGGTLLGTARARALYEQGTDTYRMYLFDINMNSGQSFSQVKSIGYTATDFMNTVLVGGQTVLQETSRNNLLFPLPRSRPTETGISPDAITVQRRYTFTTGVGETSVTGETGTVPGTGGGGAGPGSGYVYTNGNQWVLSDSSGSILNVTPTNVTNTTFDYSGLTQSKNYEVLAQVQKASPTARAKVLNETTLSRSWPSEADSDGTGTLYFNLDKADIYDVLSIKQTDSDGSDISDNFTIDNGQRDNFYGLGRLIVKPSASLSGTIFTRYRYFTHQAGDFFDVTSYPTATVPYEKIPSFTFSDGSTVNLRDFIDFRPVAVKGPGNGSGLFGSYMTFDSDGSGSEPIINFLPTNSSTFTADITYYLPRIDRLVAASRTDTGEKNPRGEIRVIKGVADLDPQPPEIPAGSMALYDFKYNAYTFNDSDIVKDIIPAKGYSMADIGQLEKRLENLEELTTLSLLELDTSSLSVLDSAGLTRTKAGFLVDNFRNFNFSAIDREEYRAVLDEDAGHLTPINIGKSVELIADSATSTSIAFRGDAAYLSVDSNVTILDQNLATEALNINPFAVIVSNGHTVLSPEADNWVETKFAPDRVVSRTTRTITGNTTDAGRALAGRRSRARNDFSAAQLRRMWLGNSRAGRGNIRSSVSITRVVGSRVIDVSVIPFMRSRIVFFKTEGLRPNAQHFLTFGGQDMASYVRQETTFKRIGGRNSENIRSYTNAAAHPSGATTLFSDSAGSLIGSFLVPSTNSLRFRTGAQQVDIMDVSGGNLGGSTSNSITTYAAAGELRTVQRDVSINSIRLRRERREREPRSGRLKDPLAQSFYVDPVENPNGYFITQIQAFFKSKSTEGVPVQCQIRELENGFPTDRPLPGAVKFLPPTDVSLPSAKNKLTIADNGARSAPTTFQFDEPVFVEPGRNYAVVLLAESVEYEAYVAKTYEFLLGSTEARVNKQPTLGSLFLSQNGVTWTPDQTRDLMFKIKRAQFAASGTLKLQNAEPGLEELFNNPISSDSGTSIYRVFHEGHGFVRGDAVTVSGLDSSQQYAGVFGATIMGSQTITRVDHTGYMFDAGGSAAVGTLRFGGNNVIVNGQNMYDQFFPSIQTFVPEDASLNATIVTASGASFGSTRDTGSTGSKSLSTSKSITLNEFNFNESPQCVYSLTNEASTDNDFPDKSVKLDITLSTIDNKVSPVIDLQRSSMFTFENVIDTQDSADFATVNVPLSRIAETDPNAGTSAAKHVTVPVVLEEPAKGLKILFAGNRPSVSKFKVYFKTATSDEDLNDISYTLINEFTNNPSDEDKDVFRQYEFLPGGTGGFLADFTKFQVKIEMVSTNTSKIPTIKDLRIIALVT